MFKNNLAYTYSYLLVIELTNRMHPNNNDLPMFPFLIGVRFNVSRTESTLSGSRVLEGTQVYIYPRTT